MSKDKIIDKLKEGISVQEVENFARKHTSEVFSLVALIVAAISSMFDFFTGPSMTILFMAIGAIVGILMPESINQALKRYYQFTENQEKTTRMMIGGVKIVVGIFIPFVLFGLYGLLAGTSYSYFSRHSNHTSGSGSAHSRKGHGGDHD